MQACTVDGTVYDITNIVPYVQKFKKHPVSGEPLQLRDIIQLHFHKNADNEYHDPILHKVTSLLHPFHVLLIPAELLNLQLSSPAGTHCLGYAVHVQTFPVPRLKFIKLLPLKGGFNATNLEVVQCAVCVQVFTESTHIVAVKTSGHVYAYDAIRELNIKPKFMKDLMTDQPFTRKDIIHIQDPMNLEVSASVHQ